MTTHPASRFELTSVDLSKAILEEVRGPVASSARRLEIFGTAVSAARAALETR